MGYLAIIAATVMFLLAGFGWYKDHQVRELEGQVAAYELTIEQARVTNEDNQSTIRSLEEQITRCASLREEARDRGEAAARRAREIEKEKDEETRELRDALREATSQDACFDRSIPSGAVRLLIEATTD